MVVYNADHNYNVQAAVTKITSTIKITASCTLYHKE